MTVTVISGAGLRDDIFTTDAAIIGEEITWNVTRLTRDAKQGAFGKWKSAPMSALPPMTPEMAANIDWMRVENILGAHLHNPNESPLDMPALQVRLPRPDGTILRIPIDGNHRICARRIAGYPDFIFWDVPSKLEGIYRVKLGQLTK